MAKTKKRKKALLTNVIRAGTVALPRRVKKKKKAPRKKKRSAAKKSRKKRTVKKRAVKKLSASRRAIDVLERRAARAREENRLRALELIADIGG